MENRRLIFIPALLLLFLQETQASLYMEIRLLSYKHGCDEDIWPFDSNCDPTFTFCVDRPTKNIRFNKGSCQYSFVSESSHFQNYGSINFQTVSNKRGVPVPWRFKVDKIWDSQILFAVEIYDDDSATNDDHMITLARNMTLNIYATELEAHYAFIEMLDTEDDYHRFRYEIRIYCAGNYYGNDCQTYCLASSDSSGHYTCEQRTGRKLCLKGWKGKDCNIDVDECELNFCQGGTCINSPGDYVCHCPDYFTGRNCTVMTNPCGSNPCQMGGLCDGDPQTFTYTCHCIPGWEGMQCNVKSDPCDEKPCKNDGQCESTDSNFSYTCSCPYGWLGKDCDERLDPCDSNPCLNGGTCDGDFEHLNYTCICVSGWLGERCEVKFEPCISEPCQNEAICDENITTHSYHCSCQSGWEGTHCEIKSDPCLLNPCQNSGTCQSSEDNFSYNCSCLYGWEGEHCEKRTDPCDSGPCQNGASCHGNREYLNYTCTCSPGWLGENCEEEYKPCTSEPCQNGGQCQADIALYTYNCSCVSGWEGDVCEIKSNPCDSLPCQNNGTCQATDQNFNYTCTCSEKYTGMHCETEIIDGNYGAFSETKSSSVAWRIPVAVLAAGLLLIIIVFIFVLWRKRRGKSKLQYVSDTLPPVVVFEANGRGNFAFENQAYTQVNRVNQEIETGRGNRIILPQPTTPTEDDLFNPVKPSFVLDDEVPGAVGGASNSEDCSDKKTGPKASGKGDMDDTDLKYSQVSTLSRRPISERADENPYQDFRSLSKRQPREDEVEEDDPHEEEEEEDHYQTLDEVADSVRNSLAHGGQDTPPALPPFNFGVQKNPLLQLSNNLDMDSDNLNCPDREASGVSHYQEPDDFETSPDDVYSEVDKKRHEQDTLPRRPHYMNSATVDEENGTDNDESSDPQTNPSTSSHYDIPTGAGPKSEPVINDKHVYDNPRDSDATPYDVPRSLPAPSEDNFNGLFEKRDPWTPDPFATSSSTLEEPNQNDVAVYDNDVERNDQSDEENQEDLAQLRQEVRDFMEKLDCKAQRESSSNA